MFSSGVKNLVSTRLFTLSDHAGARKCAGNRQQMQSICPKNSRRRFFVGITGCLCSATSIRSEKNAIERFFHSFDHVSLHSRFPERECPAAERDQYSMFSCASHSHHPYNSGTDHAGCCTGTFSGHRRHFLETCAEGLSRRREALTFCRICSFTPSRREW